jgi:hypothetical protein
MGDVDCRKIFSHQMHRSNHLRTDAQRFIHACDVA